MAKKKAKTSPSTSASKPKRTSASESRTDSITLIATAIEIASQASNFCVSDTLPPANPQLKISGVGEIKLPLSPKQAKAMIEVARIAPYGKGTKTLVDTRVRKTFEIDASQIELSAAWNQLIEAAVTRVAERLGLNDEKMSAQLYKLLLYERGGHFMKHRDSEKSNRMIASLIVLLPTRFEGGELVVHHKLARERISFETARNEQAPEFAAFYADCEHEVLPVESGRRLCLAYNLIVKKSTREKKGAIDVDDITRLANSISAHAAKRPDCPLVFALEHQYTQAGLRAELLKGTDRTLAKQVESAAQRSGCRVYLAQVERHLSQHADDGSWGYDRWNRQSRSTAQIKIADLQIGEAFEDNLNGSQWRDFTGKPQSFGVMPFDTSSIISRIPLDDWKPTTEEYEGYTGNAGNTLDRWYHCSAIVLWSDDHHFDVIVQGGIPDAAEMYFAMQKRLAKTPKKRIAEARDECFRLARAILRRWPVRNYFPHYDRVDHQPTLQKFIDSLPEYENNSLHDVALDALMLDRVISISDFVTAVSRQQGIDWIVPKLKKMLETPISKWIRDLVPRDVACLQALCCDPNFQNNRDQLKELCESAAVRFNELCDEKTDQRNARAEGQEATKILEQLLQSSLAIGHDPIAARLIERIRRNPDRFTHEQVQVPCLLKLWSWSQKQFNQIPRVMSKWHDDVVAELTSATTVVPPQPADWARPAEIKSSNKFGQQINEFLADPYSETLTLPAAEQVRSQIIDTVSRYRCDLSHRLEKIGSPHRLVFTKTVDSWKRSVKQYETNVKLLAELALIRK